MIIFHPFIYNWVAMLINNRPYSHAFSPSLELKSQVHQLREKTTFVQSCIFITTFNTSF